MKPTSELLRTHFSLLMLPECKVSVTKSVQEIMVDKIRSVVNDV